MDIVESIKREHVRMNTLLDKLGETSDGAVKTRGRLAEQLTTSLDAHMSVVQDHVYPLLRRHEQTRELVPDLKERNDLKRRLAEFGRLPKDDEGFLGALKELKKAVEQHLRAEEKQIFPAIRKTIGADEAEDLAKRMTGALRQEIDEARSQPEEENGDAAVKKTSRVVGEGIQRAADETTETLRTVADAATAGSRRIVETANEQAQRAGGNALGAARVYAETGQRAAEGLRPLLGASAASYSVMHDVQRVWIEWIEEATQVGGRGMQAILRSSTPRELAEAHRRLVNESMGIWMNGASRVLERVRHAATDGLGPIQQQLNRRRDGDAAGRPHIRNAR